MTLAHLVDYAHCNNVKASVQMMEVCRRNDYNNTNSNSHHQAAQQAPPLVANFVPSSNGNVTFTINNQLTNQVQRLVRERASGYDNLVRPFLHRNYKKCLNHLFNLVINFYAMGNYKNYAYIKNWN